MCLRIVLLAALASCTLLAPTGSRLPVALVSITGLALLSTLSADGVLQRLARTGHGAVVVIACLIAPFFLLLGPRSVGGRPAPRSPDDTIADIADALASESDERQRMVEALLDLGRRTVEDIMVPRSEIEGIDISADWDAIVERLRRTPHTRMPLFDGDLDRVQGIVHMRLVANELAAGRLTRDRLREIAARREALFTHEGTTLDDQLLRFRRLRRRIAFVVDEYGDLQGLVTLEDILEEIIGEFTTQSPLQTGGFVKQPDGAYLVEGATLLRELNRKLGFNFPLDGPKTLNGLILEHLQSMPEPSTSVKIAGHPLEIVQTQDRVVKAVRVVPPARS